MLDHTPCDEERSRLFADLCAQHERAGRALYALDSVLKSAESGPVDEWTVAHFRKVYDDLLDPARMVAVSGNDYVTAVAS